MTAEVETRIRSDARDNRARIVMAARMAIAAEGADRDRGFRAYVAQLPRTAAVTADRDRALRMLLELPRRWRTTASAPSHPN